MERAHKRTDARKIESTLLNKIALKGSKEIAQALGIDRCQITRWKKDFIPKISMLLAVLEWGVVDDDMARLAKQVANILKSEKAPAARTAEASQMTIDF